MDCESYRETLGGKIHRATVTDANVDYIGSITIDVDLLERADIWVGQKVQVVSITTGERLDTYTLAGERGSGVIAINGAAALRIRTGEIVIIIGYEIRTSPKQNIATVLVDSNNQFIRVL